MTRKAILLAIYLCLGACCLAAPSYTFRRYGPQDGLSSGTVRAMIQDGRGFIWAGTSSGLDIFDGREFFRKELDPLSSDYVNCLWEDRDRGVIWVGTDDAVYGVWDEVVRPVEGLPKEAAICLCGDGDGNLWVSMRNFGLYRVSPQGGIYSYGDYFAGSDIHCLFVDSSNCVWACPLEDERGHYCYTYNAAEDVFQKAAVYWTGASPSRIGALAEDEAGNIWIGTWDRGLYMCHASSREVRRRETGKGLKGLTNLHTLFFTDEGAILAGSDDGLLWFDPLTGESALYVNDIDDMSSLSNKFVYPIISDHEGGIWIGTYYGGINYVSPTAGLFENRRMSSLSGNTEDNTVSCLCSDADGTIWAGSDAGGLVRYDPASDRIRGSWAHPRDLPSSNIHALCRQGGYLWIGAYSGGISRMNVNTGSIKVYATPESSYYSIMYDRDGTLWAAGMHYIERYDPQGDSFVTEIPIEETATALLHTSSGEIWCSTTGRGIYCRDISGRWRQITVSDGLPTNYINTLASGPSNIIYIGTKRGLVVFDGGQMYSPDLGGIYDIRYIVPQPDCLWLATGSGILRYYPDGQIEHYGERDGVMVQGFLPNSGMVDAEGKVWLGGVDGFLSFYPRRVVRNASVPPVVIKTLEAESVQDGRLAVSEARKGGITLPHTDHDVAFSFASLSYRSPHKNRFSCMLEGFDRQWRDLEETGCTEYSNLPPGHYTFRVRATNNDGVWNTEGDSVSLTIKPHPLRSPVAVTLYIVLLFSLFIFAARQWIKHMQNRSREEYNRQLQVMMAKVKEEESDDRYKLVSTLAGDIKEPLTGLNTWIERIRQGKSAEGLKKELDGLDKSRRLLESLSTNLVRMETALSGGKASDPSSQAPGRQPALTKEQFLERLDKYVDDNLSNPNLSVGMLASELAVSRSGLFAKVKEVTGLTPNELIRTRRLKTAAKLLGEDGLAVGNVCYMTGFSSPSYFSKSFFRQYGVTPHEWASAQRDKTNGQ